MEYFSRLVNRDYPLPQDFVPEVSFWFLSSSGAAVSTIHPLLWRSVKSVRRKKPHSGTNPDVS